MTSFKNIAAIGVIGGADGPTSLFVSGLSPSMIILGVAAIALIVAAIVFSIKNKK